MTFTSTRLAILCHLECSYHILVSLNVTFFVKMSFKQVCAGEAIYIPAGWWHEVRWVEQLLKIVPMCNGDIPTFTPLLISLPCDSQFSRLNNYQACIICNHHETSQQYGDGIRTVNFFQNIFVCVHCFHFFFFFFFGYVSLT